MLQSIWLNIFWQYWQQFVEKGFFDYMWLRQIFTNWIANNYFHYIWMWCLEIFRELQTNCKNVRYFMGSKNPVEWNMKLRSTVIYESLLDTVSNRNNLYFRYPHDHEIRSYFKTDSIKNGSFLPTRFG